MLVARGIGGVLGLIAGGVLGLIAGGVLGLIAGGETRPGVKTISFDSKMIVSNLIYILKIGLLENFNFNWR
ncbi:hypothetical protein NPIL_348191 [Nephila pilipes]|uniref:Uncharacterized protein n=1 Tax=Nephila pilipes TaxID=299642 RepID=A0A8X6QGH5_NEPPI|nr:hypothetical protein NPIL_348191 [Nephila pilipes]